MLITHRSRALTRALVAATLVVASVNVRAAVDPDGWQILASVPKVAPQAPVATPASASVASVAPASGLGSADVAAVVLPGASTPSTPSTLTFSVTPQDVNLRDALDRWLQQQGWQLAWKIDDDLPLEFNATFTGDFTSVLQQVMKATNHMRTPTRACRHTNQVIRVIVRAGNCQD
ncbi:MAG: toxin co-regulated pilus biosynthesis Q family protein [Burkholderia contaminans]|uniref:Pilus assembly protein n=1 Tax=Burkholderia aenigmatica TaxID=2015348 RepID=A0A228HNU7_9BURK|nr:MULTISPECIES: toxin co-regulated pilus biosynthesis Q family protein [Burkholderia cepacia complex]KVR74393.1 pilus assembly protein [Burkholderia vietnamiensis]KVS01600.1 pilus assembly protein [Burkholderia vietnamiensis]MBR8009296.1 toxin co-regulated pilus biosynthesis Q family protein [Burkholderia vietnamiensis]MBR8150842.1 toxin co-regulated pilus biosynthesis Q family protein [Burkholderia vietnamiensis]MBR8164828.1 toxin co-regulated pilus biosynthesis Q family protein [Burkholderi